MAEVLVGRRIARGCDERRDCEQPIDPGPGVVTPVRERRSANRSATRGRGLVGAQALERHQMHSEAGAGARARSVLTHRVGWQSMDGVGQSKRHVDGGVGLEGQRGVQVFTALRSSRQRWRASALAFRYMGFEDWA
jgi:hypothetical protein